jgi:hypothetical protein
MEHYLTRIDAILSAHLKTFILHSGGNVPQLMNLNHEVIIIILFIFPAIILWVWFFITTWKNQNKVIKQANKAMIDGNVYNIDRNVNERKCR